ncbi:MAG TPA: fused MFS/spermidine synthase [Pseudoduganella sp.]
MVILYAATIFLSAFLLFQIQPLIGKMILPLFGGSAAVWSTCMLFFQVLLLLGYLYAHLTTRYLRPRWQVCLHLGLLAISAALLPIASGPGWKPEGDADPTLLIVGLMATAIGLPYFLLSSTGPLVQAWFAAERPGSVPYRLFALSNFGSMLGLISYPILFEPWLPLPRMALGWSIAYACFVLVCAALTLRGLRRPAPPAAQPSAADGKGPAPAAGQWLLWALLAAIATVLLMSVTSHLTQDIAPIPLLWVLPLATYLLTFILCFEGRGWYRRSRYLPLLGVALLGMGVLYLASAALTRNMELVVAAYCIGLFLSCMVCHGELAALKPPAAYLTSFYLMVAAGGAAGGIFVTIIAPRIFSGDYELLLSILALMLTISLMIYREPAGSPHPRISKESWLKATVFAVTLISILTLGKIFYLDRSQIKLRNFYGTLKVQDLENEAGPHRRLAHGVIMHGMQLLASDRKRWPTSYYGTASGAGMAVAQGQAGGPQRIGVVGLGAGTMAAYCRPGDYYRFYEINPLVISLARQQFTFLAGCQASVDIVAGDARLSLEREPSQQFDVLVLDAFSGDAVPIHLLTKEAFAIYLRHLKPGGILAVHTSNLHLNLVPVVKLAADQLQLRARRVLSASDAKKLVTPAEWVLISRDPALLQSGQIGKTAEEIATPKAAQPWTDDYSSVYSIMR